MRGRARSIFGFSREHLVGIVHLDLAGLHGLDLLGLSHEGLVGLLQAASRVNRYPQPTLCV